MRCAEGGGGGGYLLSVKLSDGGWLNAAFVLWCTCVLLRGESISHMDGGGQAIFLI